MNFDDKLVDATIWGCIEWSNNPQDFSIYLEHRLANAAHLDAATDRYKELAGVDMQTESMFPIAVTKIEQIALAGDSTAQFHMGKFYSEGHGVLQDFATAARWYELAASQGEFRAAHNLANLKLAGRGIPQDVDGAISLYEKGIAAGDPAGAETLGSFFLENEFKDTERAAAYLKKAFELGSPSAGTRLGRLLYNEAGSAQQREEAKMLLSSLAEQNYIPAAKSLAYIYASGNRSERNYEAAKALQLKVLESGQQDAMLNLGWLDLQMPPEPANPNATPPLYWFRKAWDAGIHEASGYIGRAYLDGDSVEKSVDEALHWFKLGADKGEADCAYLIGAIHDKGWNGESSDKNAEPWYRRAAEAELAAGQIALARLLVRNTGLPVNGTEAIMWLDKAISGGSTEAMLLLAHLYQDGLGVIKNEKAAFELCLKAAVAGDLVGQSEIGWRLCRGIGCDVNMEEGVSWHKRTATAGRAYDQGILAYSYLYGQLSLEQNFDEAVKWAQLSATQNEDMGQFVLGICYYHGCGIGKDIVKACEWLTKAAEQGNVRAQAKLAEHYYYPEDEKNRDLLLAGRWASQAADAGHAGAQLMLGRMFLFGEQVERDPKAAVEWLRLAAEQGESEAMYLLGISTADGVGTKRDWMIALKWLKKAADAGIDAAVKALESFGVTYVPGSQNKHRLSADAPVVLDTEFEVRQFEGRWECQTEEAKMTYVIRADGTFSSEADLGAAEPMKSDGRWAIRGTKLIWDVWSSNIPVEDADAMDGQIAFMDEKELHLVGSDGVRLVFRKIEVSPEPLQHQVIDLTKVFSAKAR